MSKFEEQFLDYIEGRLGDNDRVAFESALTSDASLKSDFENYKQVVAVEGMFASEVAEPHPSFVPKVMASIEQKAAEKRAGFLKGLIMEMTLNRKRFAGSVATLAVVMLCITLAQKTPPEQISRAIVRNDSESGTAPAVAKEERQVTKDGASFDSPRLIPPGGGNKSPAAVADNLASLPEENEPSSPKSSSSIEDKYLAFEQDYFEKRAKESKKTFNTLDSDLKRKDSKQDVAGVGVGGRERESGADQNSQEGTAEIFKGATEGHVNSKSIEVVQPRLPDESVKMGGINPTADEVDPRLLRGGAAYYFRKPQTPSQIASAPAAAVARLITPPQVADGEVYHNYAESTWIRASDESLSTISLDVDTGSYTNVRRFLTQGKLPPVDAVRTEELINYFHYDYPSVSDRPFTVSYEMAPSPLQTDRMLLKLGIKANDRAAASDLPWNLVFLVDVSGSMQPANKLPLVKRAMHVLAEKMRPMDRIAIVTYADAARLALPSLPGTAKQQISSAIDQLSPSGGTNGSGGIQLAYEIAQANRVSGGVNRVIMATDGDFNVGVVNFNDLTSMIEQKRRSGISLTTIGVGEGNLKEASLEQLADKGNGNYFYLDNFQEARKIFEGDLVKNMNTVAKDAKVQIEFNPAAVADYRLVGYDNRKLGKSDFKNDAVDAGEVGAGQTVTVLYEVRLVGSIPGPIPVDSEYRYKKPAVSSEIVQQKPAAMPNTPEFAFVKIRYKEPNEDVSKPLQFPLLSSEIKREATQTSNDFRFAAAVSYFAAALKNSEHVGWISLEQVATLAAAAKGSDADGKRQEFLELVRNANALVGERRYVEPEQAYTAD